MARRGRRSLAALILTWTLWGCSLMGLDDFDPAPCRSDADCKSAEARLRPNGQACGAAVCDGQFCTWRAFEEFCNGDDDDCDGLIDEDLSPPVHQSSAASAPPTAVAYAVSTEARQTFVATAVEDGSSQLFTLGPGDGVTSSDLHYESTLGNSAVDSRACPKWEALLRGGAPAMCNFSELALAVDTTHLVVASINTLGCAAGQVRVGLSNLGTTPNAVWLGKRSGAQTDEESNIAFGVDFDSQGCTGASRTSEPGASAIGATRPAVASLGTRAGEEGALLLWLATPVSDGNMRELSSASESIPVEALGLLVPPVAPEWLNGTNEGQPIEIGRTTSRSPPAVLALRSARPGKYLVAFAAERDTQYGIQLLVVRAADTSLSFEALEFLDTGAAEDVSMALASTDPLQVGLAWHSGSGSTAQLNFRVISTSGVVLAAANPIATPRPLFMPQILYRGSGFATKAPSGGWFLSWVESLSDDEQSLQVARFRDGTLQILSQTRLESGAIGQPLMYPSDDGSNVGYALIKPSTAGMSRPETYAHWCSDRG